MKEKMISTVASRGGKSPTKISSVTNIARPMSKTSRESGKGNDERNSTILMDQNLLAKLCENSRNLSSSLSHEEDTSSSTEPRSRYVSSRTSTSTRSTPHQNRKGSRGSDEIVELAKAVQDGMSDLAIVDDTFQEATPDEIQRKMEAMKQDLMNKITKNEEPVSRKSSALRRKSTEESIEEEIVETIERPKSRGRRNSTVSFYDSSDGINYSTGDEVDKVKIKRETSNTEKKMSGKHIDKYCKDIIQDIEKSSKIIDVHMKQLTQSKFAGEKLAEQLQAVDKLNDFVNGSGDIPNEAFEELNNNFKMLTDQVLTEVPVARKRSVSSRLSSRINSANNLLGDANMSNQDLLNDLLGKK